MSLFSDHPIIKVIGVAISIGGFAIAFWQWGESIKRAVRDAPSTEKIAQEIVNDESFVKNVALYLSNNEDFSRKVMGPKGEIGQEGKKGEDGINPDPSSVANLVITKLKESQEVEKILLELKNSNKNTEVVEIGYGTHGELLNGSLIVSVISIEVGQCTYQVSTGSSSTGEITSKVGSSESLSTIGLAGRNILLLAAYQVYDHGLYRYCKFSIR